MHFPRISDLRADRDLTQQQIAELLHCNRQVYARYERGLREIPVSLLIKLAQFYGVSLDYLTGLTNVSRPYPETQDRKKY